MLNVSEPKKVLTAHGVLFKTLLCLPGAFFFLLACSFYFSLLSLRAALPQTCRDEAPFLKKVSHTHTHIQKKKPAVRDPGKGHCQNMPPHHLNVWTIT